MNLITSRTQLADRSAERTFLAELFVMHNASAVAIVEQGLLQHFMAQMAAAADLDWDEATSVCKTSKLTQGGRSTEEYLALNETFIAKVTERADLFPTEGTEGTMVRQSAASLIAELEAQRDLYLEREAKAARLQQMLADGASDHELDIAATKGLI